MSIISSLVLVLLCFSFHACSSRSFGVVHKKTANQFHHSIDKKHEELNSARVSTTPNAMEDIKKEVIFEEKKVNIINESKNYEEKGEKVSWRVPHKKRGEQEPGFNLDYLPPKTHPPAHN